MARFVIWHLPLSWLRQRTDASLLTDFSRALPVEL